MSKKVVKKSSSVPKKKSDSSKYMFFSLLAIIVVGTIIFFSISSNSPSVTGAVVATVNGEDITLEGVASLQKSIAQQGQQLSTAEALEQAINQELLSQEAIRLGYGVSIDEVEEIISLELEKNGGTLEEYRGQLELQGGSYEKQLVYLQKDLSIRDYLVDAIEDDVVVLDGESEEFYELYKEQSPDEIPSFEELEEQIVFTLKAQKQQQAINLLVQELRVKANIEYA